MKQQGAQAVTGQHIDAEYAGLTDEERSTLGCVAQHFGYATFDKTDKGISEAFKRLRPSNVTGEEEGTDLCIGIQTKYNAIFAAAAEMAEEELQRRGFRLWDDFALKIVIDPSWEDCTSAAIIDFNWSQRPYCYFLHSSEAWNFHFDTLRDIASEVFRVRDAIIKTFLWVRGRDGARGRQGE